MVGKQISTYEWMRECYRRKSGLISRTVAGRRLSCVRGRRGRQACGKGQCVPDPIHVAEWHAMWAFNLTFGGLDVSSGAAVNNRDGSHQEGGSGIFVSSTHLVG